LSSFAFIGANKSGLSGAKIGKDSKIQQSGKCSVVLAGYGFPLALAMTMPLSCQKQ
jgi:hypothetical protein